MEKRNFYILIASIMVGMTVFWLSVYAIIILDVDPFWRLNDDDCITITGNVTEDLILSLEDIKSFILSMQLEENLMRYTQEHLFGVS